MFKNLLKHPDGRMVWMDTFEVGVEHVRDATDMVAVRENFLATSVKPRGVRLHLRGRVAPVDGRVGGSGTGVPPAGCRGSVHMR